MRKTSLLGHLVIKLTHQQENIATEALNHILNTSSTARKSFLRYIEQTSIKFEDLKFSTQIVCKDKATPDVVSTDKNKAILDLVGIDADGDKVLIIESKFWAGLTGNQPVAYLNPVFEFFNKMAIAVGSISVQSSAGRS